MQINPWLKTAIFAALGGGVAGSVAALADPTKYRFPQDLGSGRMWPFFLSGAAMTVGAMLLKSPLGQSAMKAYTESQEQLKADKALLEQTKQDIKASTKPPESTNGDAK